MASAVDTAAQACATCTSGELATAKGFKRTESAVRRYYKDVSNQWAKYHVPPMNEIATWKVYKLSSTKMFKHFSLYFKCDSDQYEHSPGFTIELQICTEKGIVIPITTLENVSDTKNLSYLGSITDSAKEIMDTGLECLEEFGDYDFYWNNCQKFCSNLAKKLDMKEPWTQSEKVLGWGVAGAIGIGILGGIAALWSRGSGNSKEQKR